MKDKIIIPIPKQEDLDALNKRRETYASKRDQQATEFNQAISKRLHAEAMHMIKCKKCGKEFSSSNISDTSQECPECTGKPE